MNEIFTLLEQEWGLNKATTMTRFVDDEKLYLACLESYSHDYGFGKLQQALKRRDYQEAFTQAHILKGVADNLGLAKMYFDLASLTAKLKAQDEAALEEAYSKISNWHHRLQQLF